MARSENVPTREEFLRQAEAAYDRMFGEERQESLVTFTQQESCAFDEGRRLGSWLLERHIMQDPYRSTQEALCPVCGQPGERLEAEEEERAVESRSGEISFHRAKFSCARCRRVFFPLGFQDAAAGQSF